MKVIRIKDKPNSETFQIKEFFKIIQNYHVSCRSSIDPFARNTRNMFPDQDLYGNNFSHITNDLNENCDTDYHMDALDFLKMFESRSIDFVLFDPPYSLRQVKECYNSVGVDNMTQHQSKYWYSDLKNEIARITIPGAIVISFGWNSNGMGKNRNFRIEEIIMCSHGGNHNDTIMTIERKLNELWGY
tara:strand:- start:242 stop:802 length:561 start_codon:yes stop_codon:yes gene_type:complete